jgi:uncharacterized membrane protein YdjX (TVP38/TMEM64 family)
MSEHNNDDDSIEKGAMKPLEVEEEVCPEAQGAFEELYPGDHETRLGGGEGEPVDVEPNDGDNDEVQKEGRRRTFYLKVVIGLLLLGFVIFVIVDTLTNGYVKDGIEQFLKWVEENPAGGVFVFIIGMYFSTLQQRSLILHKKIANTAYTCNCTVLAVYFLATVLFIPASLLTLGAGFVFASAFGLGGGIALATLAVFIGACLGAIASFLLGRYLLRDFVQRLTKKYTIFKALDAALEENGLKIFLLLRLSPIIPFNVINYIGGVSAVSLRDYVLALIAVLPGTILYVFLGASAGSLTDSASSDDDRTVTIVVIVVGAVLGIGAVWLSTRYARRELNRIVEERQAVADGDTTTAGDEIGDDVTDVIPNHQV